MQNHSSVSASFSFSCKIYFVAKYYFQVASADFKKRLDVYLQEQFPTLSKIYLREIVRDEKCEVNGEWQSRGYLVKTNDFVEVELEQRENNLIEPEELPLEIIHEETDFLVVNKVAGMLVHPTVKIRNGTLLNALAHYLNTSREQEADSRLTIHNSRLFIRAGLVHRLDKQTSGLVVIAKNQRSLKFLCSHFQRRLVEKKYFALVEGIIKEDSRTIDAPIGRYEESRFWNIKEDGKRAVTNFWVKKRFADSTLLELEPVTGRTNQLRIHLAHINHPIFGDVKYGGREFSRLCLHAYKLGFHHPTGGKRIEFETVNPFNG
jgi:23S rRNA pseudouridine1911/1915/1917 synthase